MLLHSLHRYCLTPISPSYKSATILLSQCTRLTSILAGSDSNRLRFVPEHTAVCNKQLKQLRDQLNLLTSTSAQDKRDGLLVITGAGISTESGIPDYRSAGVGLYSRSGQRPVQYADFIASDKVRRRYWARSCVGWRRLRRIQPNSTHSVLAKAERCGRVHTIVTQNVDRLHHKAGSRNVVELHGSLYDVVCTGCDYCVSRDDFQEMMLRLNANHFRPEEAEMRPDGDVDLDEATVADFVVPECPNCSSTKPSISRKSTVGVLKPDIVFFGDCVPSERVDKIRRLVDSSRALLVVGSSLHVYSSYRFVDQAANADVPVFIVNIGPTRGDHLARMCVSARAGEVLPLLGLDQAD